jgi:hypothetical protein
MTDGKAGLLSSRPMLNADLHCHSTVSDGVLAPAAVVARAAAQGVELLALTDHDDLSGLGEAAAAAAGAGVGFVPGVEVSVTWSGLSVHVVGLAIDPAHAPLAEGLAAIRAGRAGRARRMADALEAIGIGGALAGAKRYAGNPALISRTHFARLLVERGCACDVRGVFEHYLVKGKPGYVEHEWATLAQALDWISGAGGIAVLAHPGRYRIGREKLTALAKEFRDFGGAAIEVSSGAHTPEQTRDMARLARHLGLMASRGSDFHAPDESPVELGGTPELSGDLTPVWHRLI